MHAIESDSFRTRPRPRARLVNQIFIADEGRVRGRRRGRYLPRCSSKIEDD